MLANVMRYKEYYAEVKYDSSADAFHGRVLGMADVIDFYGRSTEELRRELENSVEAYLAWCREEGEKAEKTWSSKMTLRPDERLHRRIVAASAASGESINGWIIKVLDRETRRVLGE